MIRFKFTPPILRPLEQGVELLPSYYNGISANMARVMSHHASRIQRLDYTPVHRRKDYGSDYRPVGLHDPDNWQATHVGELEQEQYRVTLSPPAPTPRPTHGFTLNWAPYSSQADLVMNVLTNDNNNHRKYIIRPKKEGEQLRFRLKKRWVGPKWHNLRIKREFVTHPYFIPFDAVRKRGELRNRSGQVIEHQQSRNVLESGGLCIGRELTRGWNGWNGESIVLGRAGKMYRIGKGLNAYRLTREVLYAAAHERTP